jgi:hypothetical protein
MSLAATTGYASAEAPTAAFGHPTPFSMACTIATANATAQDVTTLSPDAALEALSQRFTKKASAAGTTKLDKVNVGNDSDDGVAGGT